MQPYVVWPWTAGLSVLLVGLIVSRRSFQAGRGLDALLALAPVLVAAPLAAFAAEHFVIGFAIQNMVPAWMPARLFVAYFVGVALLAAAVSLAVHRFVPLAASLLALMLTIFVVSLHVPNAVAGPDRFAWIVALRDLSFAGGALALASAARRGPRTAASGGATAGRLIVGAALVVFGVVQVLLPAHAPGVPLQKVTPPWIPGALVWGYAVGAIEVVAGGLLLADRRTRETAAWMGLVVLVLVVGIYLPIVPGAVTGGEKLEALNYVWDTVLFAGTVLAIGRSSAALDNS